MIAHETIEKLLSPYVDGELTQAESQRVRIHLEDCAECRAAIEQMERLRRVAAEMRFAAPPEDQMSELEQKLSVQAPRRAGWLLLITGAAVWSLYAAYLFVLSPEMATFEKLTVGAMVIGLVLLLISVLRQRLLEMPGDRYRRVKR